MGGCTVFLAEIIRYQENITPVGCTAKLGMLNPKGFEYLKGGSLWTWLDHDLYAEHIVLVQKSMFQINVIY